MEHRVGMVGLGDDDGGEIEDIGRLDKGISMEKEGASSLHRGKSMSWRWPTFITGDKHGG